MFRRKTGIISVVRLTLIPILFSLLFSPWLFAQQVSEINLDKLLEMSLEDLTKVKVVSVSKKSQNIKEAPAVVRVITSKQIEERGYLTLEEALADLPGFQFRNILGFNSYVFQRGIPSQNNLILVLVDGIQINELNSGGFYGGGQFNLPNVEQIEVVYGPASALYGTNAFSGIINIITKNPKEAQGLTAEVLYGTFNTLNTSLSYGGYDEKNDWGVRLSGMIKKTEKADLAGAEGDYNWTEDMENFENDYSCDAKMTYKNLTAGLTFQDKQTSRSTNYRSVDTKYQDNGTNWHIRFINSYLKHVCKKWEKWNLTSQLYYRNATVMDNTIAYIDTVSQTGYYRPNYLIGLESIINYAFNDRLSLISGIAFENEALAEGFSITHSASPTEHPSTPHSPNMENDHIVSAYMQAQYQLLRIIQLSAGARYDNSSVYNEVLTPRMSIIYNRNNLTAKLLYMEAFRAPKPWDYNWGAGNQGLQPEKMRSWEVFFAYNFIKNFRGEISLYRNNTYNILYQSSSLNMWVNQGILITDGVELTLNYYTHELRPYINYTYNYSHFNQQNSQIPEIAHHSANLGLQYIITNKIKFNLSGNYLGSRKNPQIIPTTGDNKVDPALVLNSVLTYSGPNNLNFQLIIKNLLDTKYYHTSNVTDPSYSVSRFRQAQRTILFRIIWQIKV